MMEKGYEKEKSCNFKVSLMPQFPHEDRSYKCICGLIHVKIATRAIGTVTMLLNFITLFWTILIYSNKKYGLLGSTIPYSIAALVIIIATIALFFGIIQKRCKFLLPFIFIQITVALISTVFLIMVIIFVICNTWHIIYSPFREILMDSKNQSQAKALLICILIIHILFSLWSIRVVCTCYRYFDELENFYNALIMDINCLILFLCLYQTVRCIQIVKDSDNDGEEANEKIRKLESYGRKERNKENQNIDTIDPRKYLDSLLQNTIKNIATVIDITEKRQQYIVDLRNKYVQFMNALDKAQTMNDNNLTKSSDGQQQYAKKNIRCAEENCSMNNFRDKNKPKQRPFNRTATWLEHKALKFMFLNTTKKCIEQMFGNIEIRINVERRADDFYVWAIIPQKVLNESTFGVEPIKSDIGMKSRIIRAEHASFDNKTEISTITLPNLPEIPTLGTWWNSIWFWIIHFIALILFIILVLSCFIWHFGSSNKHSDYIRI
ncbi:Tanabin [Dirofilaria immitis]